MVWLGDLPLAGLLNERPLFAQLTRNRSVCFR